MHALKSATHWRWTVCFYFKIVKGSLGDCAAGRGAATIKNDEEVLDSGAGRDASAVNVHTELFLDRIPYSSIFNN
jgi:hypothetical protein